MSLPVSVGFPVIENVMERFLQAQPESEWYFGNVYDRRDGVTPLNWWKEEYRNEEKWLIDEGRSDDATGKGIHDVRHSFGDKFERGIQELLERRRQCRNGGHDGGSRDRHRVGRREGGAALGASRGSAIAPGPGTLIGGAVGAVAAAWAVCSPVRADGTVDKEFEAASDFVGDKLGDAGDAIGGLFD